MYFYQYQLYFKHTNSTTVNHQRYSVYQLTIIMLMYTYITTTSTITIVLPVHILNVPFVIWRYKLMYLYQYQLYFKHTNSYYDYTSYISKIQTAIMTIFKWLLRKTQTAFIFCQCVFIFSVLFNHNILNRSFYNNNISSN